MSSIEAVDLFAEMPELTLSPLDLDEGDADAAAAAAASPPPDESKSASGGGADVGDALDKMYIEAGMQLPSMATDDEEPEEEPAVEEKHSRSKAATSATGKKGRGRPRRATAPKDDDDEADEDFEPEKKSSSKKKATATAAKKRGTSSAGAAGAKKEPAKPRGGKKAAATGGRKRKSSPAREEEDEEAEEAVESEPDDFEAELAAASKFKSRARAPAARGRAGKAPLSPDFDIDDAMGQEDSAAEGISAIEAYLKQIKVTTAANAAKKRKIVGAAKEIAVEHSQQITDSCVAACETVINMSREQVNKITKTYERTLQTAIKSLNAYVKELQDGMKKVKKLGDTAYKSWEKEAGDEDELGIRTEESAAKLRKINADFEEIFMAKLAKLEKTTAANSKLIGP